MPASSFKAAIVGSAANFASGIDIGKFPSNWITKAKRSVAGRVSHEVWDDEPPETSTDAPACKGVQYADVYVWAGDDAVYILKGSKENHDALDQWMSDAGEKPSYEDYIKSLGADYHPNWRESDYFREASSEQLPKIHARDGVVEAEPAGNGAGDEPMDVKDTLD